MSARSALARASIDPLAAVAAYDAAQAEPPLEVVADVEAPERVRRALTLAVVVEPPPPHRRWRFFLFFCLVRLAARVYPFEFELYRTRFPWE